MIKFELLLGVISLALTLFTFIDCAQRDQSSIQKLPKWGWLLIILFFGLIGSVSYLIVGRSKGIPGPKRQNKRILPPDDDPDFLRGL